MLCPTGTRLGAVPGWFCESYCVLCIGINDQTAVALGLPALILSSTTWCSPWVVCLVSPHWSNLISAPVSLCGTWGCLKPFRIWLLIASKNDNRVQNAFQPPCPKLGFFLSHYLFAVPLSNYKWFSLFALIVLSFVN